MTRDMDCPTARLHLLADQRGQLDPATAATLAGHLERCPDCAHEERAERLLAERLDLHLPRHAASFALKRRLASQWPVSLPTSVRSPRGGSGRWLAMTAGILLAMALAALTAAWLSERHPAEPLVTEAVNDHLRVLAKGPNLDVQSGDLHQVRPWLTARLDFAPVIPFPGDADFPLRGGSLEYFLDRRAAILVYGRRLHTVTVIVTRPDGQAWPEAATPLVTSVRGFHVRLWTRGGLAYAVVSDLDPAELARFAARLGG